MKQAGGSGKTVSGPVRGRQGGFVNSRQALVLLAMLFLMPVSVAWLMHIRAEHGWRPSATTNKGTLIQPPRPLTLPAPLLGATGKPLSRQFLAGKWTLVYIGDAACAQACRDRLHQMGQARLAQGENMRRVQRLFLVTGASDATALTPILADYPGLAVALLSPGQTAEVAPVFSVGDVPMQGAGNVYLVDPQGYLMMYYRPDIDPRGMIQDLERLLKYSHVG
jgi:cytochrome oxidase Cu insertion factor (SCO1/SenC/PrrC family)